MAPELHVTILRDYFDVLVRKAQANDESSAEPSTVTILKVDYLDLLDSARQLKNLLYFLRKGSVSDEVISAGCEYNIPHDDGSTKASQSYGGFGVRLDKPNVDSQEAKPTYTSGNNKAYGQSGEKQQINHQTGLSHEIIQHRRATADQFRYGEFDESDKPVLMPGQAGNGGGEYHGGNGNRFVGQPSRQRYGKSDESDKPVLMLGQAGNGGGEYHGGNGNRFVEQPSRQRDDLSRYAQRTIALSKLAEGTTCADILEKVRGGMLLHVFIRKDQIAQVSFVYEDDARNWFGHVQRNDLYIRSKRMEIRWAEHQFTLPDDIKGEIRRGATRTIIIGNASSQHTEESIRSHAEHIHELVIISVVYQGRNIMIQCNSINNAWYLRTCMKSRECYKGYKFGWAPDDCAGPIPAPVRIPKKENARANTSRATSNRFQVLNNMDGTEDGSNVEDENDVSTDAGSTAAIDT